MPLNRELYDLASHPPSTTRSHKWKRDCLSDSYRSGRLDRVNVLGNDTLGHTGCVNALSWGQGGEVLISSGDDTTVRLWRLDQNNVGEPFPFVCNTIINTGHRANVFNAQMLPHSSRIVTVAGDNQVRVSDCENAAGSPRHTGEMEYQTQEAVIRVIRCHSRRVKRIITEDSPDLFLTVAEDGIVRQHDLRVPHSCRGGSCPAPLARTSHELSSISLSPLTPYQFVAAGDSPFGYLFDRRHAGRQFHEEWGCPPAKGELTTCVRKFGRKARGLHEQIGNEHITGTRMATSNGHEVLLSYSADAIYLYSTRDDPEPENMGKSVSDMLPSNKKSSDHAESTSRDRNDDLSERHALMDEDIERILAAHSSDDESGVREDVLEAMEEDMEFCFDDDAEEEYDEDLDDQKTIGDARFSTVPVIMPRSRFAGVCNVQTIKDVNFLGPRDEFVVSGSDDGNWFMWEKDTRKLRDILEGDGSVVNVIEGHPHLPLVAVSGIDHSIKLFAPTPGPSAFSRIDQADAIINRNLEDSAPRYPSYSRLMLSRLIHRMTEEGEEPMECTHQ